MACKCVSCRECHGSGHVWVTMGGQYLGSARSSDMDDMETCPECRGDGIEEVCDECEEAYWQEQ
jgi:hypothetical protein